MNSSSSASGLSDVVDTACGRQPFVVGIGASAGGLEALERLFDAFAVLPDNAAFVVVQHLSPDHKSLMVDLLSKRTHMWVRQAEQDQPVEAGCIYVLPPRKTITIRQGRLVLLEKETHAGIALPIDIFLTSLALDVGERAIGIILSGTGSDGSRGVKTIHEQGGVVLVQDPQTARFDGMPRAAINTGICDEILAPDRMPDRLLAYMDQCGPSRPAPDNEPERAGDADELERIVRVLQVQTGMDFSHYRRGTLRRRIERRMHLNQVRMMADYAVMLTASPQEAALLRKELLIGVTAFFRDRDFFAELAEQHVPSMLARVPEGEQVRIWVCGCATGEEAYSIGILFAEAMQNHPSRDIKIFATDIDRQALDYAGLGLYSESVTADMPPDIRERYFVRQGDNYKVSPLIRRMITFASHNVIEDPPFTKLDLVCCRNLLIYFDTPLQQRVLRRFQFALKLNGILFLGGSEALGERARYFESLGPKAKIFRLTQSDGLPLGDFIDVPSDRGPDRRGLPRLGTGGRSRGSSLDKAMQALIGACCPPTLLVSEGREILHNFGGAGRYLQLPQGSASLDLARHLLPGLATMVMTALHRAFQEWREVRVSRTPVMVDGRQELVELRLCPVPPTPGQMRQMLVMFLDQPPSGDDGTALTVDVSAAAGERIDALEAELQSARENQQAIVEELETTNEELQATNEELLAANEELQSTNEELQSVNEELYTVNSELKEKVDELTLLTSDLDNLISATEIGTIFLDGDGLLRRFTPMAATIVNMMERDVGRRISDLSTHLLDDRLAADVESVLHLGHTIERSAQCSDGRSLLVRLLPYRLDGSRPWGVVMTFVDVSRVVQAEKRLQGYINSLPHHVAVLDREGVILLVNSAWTRFSEANGGVASRTGVGSCYLTCARQMPVGLVDDNRDFVAGIQEVLEGRRSYYSLEYPCHSEREYRWFLMHAAPLVGDEGGAIISHMDITDRKRAEEDLRLAASVFGNSGEGILITDHDQRIVSVNPAFCQITGYAPEDVIGHTPRILRSDYQKPEFFRQMWVQLERDNLWRGEIWNRRKNGQIYPEWLTINRVMALDGSVSHYVGVFSDISQQKENEAHLLSINSELEQFAYVASHDLREPLRMVSSYVTLIERRLGSAVDEDLRTYLHFARDGAKRMDRLILDILEYSRIGRLCSSFCTVPLGRVIQRAVDNMQLSLEEAGATLILPQENPDIQVCEEEFVRLFQNVLSNALKYRSPDCPPRIAVHLQRQADDWCVRVADNGIGIASEHHDRVFRMFQRLHGRDDYGGGTGIGLPICRKIVEHHGGKMWLEENRDGIGVCVAFSIPVPPPEA